MMSCASVVIQLRIAWVDVSGYIERQRESERQWKKSKIDMVNKSTNKFRFVYRIMSSHMVLYSYFDSSYPWSLFWSSFKTSQVKTFNWKRDNWNCCSQSTFRTLVAEFKASPHSIHETSHLTKHMLRVVEMDEYPLSPSQAYEGIKRDSRFNEYPSIPLTHLAGR